MFFRDRKIDFSKEELVSCKLAIFVDRSIWLSFDKTRILIRRTDGLYYEPGCSEEVYQKGYGSLKRGEKFVEKTDDIPIQEIQCGK